MALVVVGGHTRNIGKTSVVAGLIRALPEMNWTAFKITQFGHGVCSANGEPCDCETADHTIAISEERRGELRAGAEASRDDGEPGGTDSARYLEAGAVRSFWVRTRQGQLAEAMPRLRLLLAKAENAIVESNSVLRFIRPDLFLTVLDPHTADFKESALRYLDRADAVLLTTEELGKPEWKGVSLRLIAGTPQFTMHPPEYVTDEIAAFVAAHLAGSRGGSHGGAGHSPGV